MAKSSSSRRLPAGPASELRPGSLRFTFDGRRHDGASGDTIGSALAADGVQVFSRSFKYHRPRGLLCSAGRCANCLVEVDGLPNARACVTPLRDGMRVRSQNAWPSLRLDVMSVVDRCSRLLPIGFYYKTFIRPRRLWPLYENVLRRAAGLGRVDVAARPHLDQRKVHLLCDVAILGGGPAGCLAALSAASSGKQVILIDDGVRLGGHLRLQTALVDGDARLVGQSGQAAAARLGELVAAERAIEHLASTTAIGIYEGNLIAAFRDSTMFRIRAGRIVVATGTSERPALFDHNDRPGVLLASGVLRLAHLQGVRVGCRVIVVTDDDNGWRRASEIANAGIEVVAIVDSRAQPGPAAPSAPASAETLVGATVLRAVGRSRVRGLDIRTSDGKEKRIAADLVAMAMRPEPSVSLAAMAEVAVTYNQASGEWLPEPVGRTGVLCAGDILGPSDETTMHATASLAGRASVDETVVDEFVAEANRARAAQAAGVAVTAVVPAGRKAFVCPCEDVTAKELGQGVDEGFDSLELLKRYSTVTMGPCQGRQCHSNAARMAAAIRGTGPVDTALTTSRPPFIPVPLAVMAGPHLMPERRTALHERHRAAGATWIDMGDWKRPLHYGDVAAECRAVHRAVGLIDVSTLGKLDVRGPDAGDFLDWLHPNRFSDLRVGRVRYRAMLDDAGVILDDGTVARLADDRFFMSTGTGSLEAVDSWLRWWLAGGERRVDVTNLTSHLAALNLAGPAARDVLMGVTPSDVSRAAFPYLTAVEISVAGVPATILRIGFVGELAYEIHVSADWATHVWDALMDAGAPFGIRPFGVEAQRILRLEKQHAIVAQDTDALSNPIEAGMGWLIKADRSDFIGRDALAAVAERGPRDALVGFEIQAGEAVPAEGAAVVRAGRAVGRVTSAKWSPTLGRPIGLAWVPVADAVDGAELAIRLETGRGGQMIRAVVRTKPFYDPTGEQVRS
jgi:sarcosine oxidase subunit alpha